MTDDMIGDDAEDESRLPPAGLQAAEATKFASHMVLRTDNGGDSVRHHFIQSFICKPNIVCKGHKRTSERKILHAILFGQLALRQWQRYREGLTMGRVEACAKAKAAGNGDGHLQLGHIHRQDACQLTHAGPLTGCHKHRIQQRLQRVPLALFFTVLVAHKSLHMPASSGTGDQTSLYIRGSITTSAKPHGPKLASIQSLCHACKEHTSNILYACNQS